MADNKQILYIDFIKGFAAISVVLLHALPRETLLNSFAWVHIWQAVPLFVFVTFYLLLRKLEKGCSLRDYYSWKNLEKILKKVIVPFLIVQSFFTILNAIVVGKEGVILMISNGGDGRGAYYPFIYCQIWLLTPFFYLLLNKIKDWNISYAIGLFTMISVLFNLLLIFELPFRFESHFIIRYIFLSLVAWQWLTKKESIIWRYVLPIISVLYWIYGIHYDLFPIIPTKGGWEGQQTA